MITLDRLERRSFCGGRVRWMHAEVLVLSSCGICEVYRSDIHLFSLVRCIFIIVLTSDKNVSDKNEAESPSYSES